MNVIIPPLMESFTQDFTHAPSSLLDELEAFTIATHLKHHMLSGKVQGRLLSMLSQMIRPQYILELGTFTGYSALCLAEGLLPDGELHTIECREADAGTALSFFKRSLWAHQLKLHIGQVSHLIPTIPHLWDLVFMDADKISLVDYYEMLIPRMQPGGWMIVDNIFFHGQVWQNPVKGKNAIALKNFVHHVAGDQRTQQVLLTVRDGLYLIKKLR